MNSTDADRLVCFFVGALGAEVLRRLWRYYFDGDRRRRDAEDRRVRDVIFFPDKAVACKDFFDSVEGCNRIRCTFSHETSGLRRLLSYIKSAKKSIDLCVYVISCHELVEAVIRRHQVGVRVRVITDFEMERNAAGSQCYRFMKDGIVVRAKKTPWLMHHKFVLIDDRTVATGSFNWTSQAVMGNNESVLVTDEPSAAAAFRAEFLQLWDAMKPGQ